MTTRRSFLKQSSFAVAGMAAGVPRWDRWTPLADRALRERINPTLVIQDASVQSLATRAIGAARAAGATYADVRLTRTLNQSFNDTTPYGESEKLGVGVRALVNGYWGFAASSYWTDDDVVRIAQDAVAQAKVYATGSPRMVEWQPVPVATGSWSTPVQYDPFTIPIEERREFAGAWLTLAKQFDRRVSAIMSMLFVRQERAVATSDGAYFTQTTYESGGGFKFIFRVGHGNEEKSPVFVLAKHLEMAGVGWERFLDADIPGQFPALLAEAEEYAHGRTFKPGDIGRYEVVCDAPTMTSITDRTLGIATQLDRALGYEANAAGTSYLGPDPKNFLGTAIASSVVNVSANRVLPRGLATVKWDDEGIAASSFPLVKDGKLVDYQTTREQAAWLRTWYAGRGTPVMSHGCAGADSALDVTMQRMPNLSLDPGSDPNVGFQALVAQTKRGIAVIGGFADTSMAGSEGGIFIGRFREIVDGKLGADLEGIVPLFNSTALWKNVTAVGGASSVMALPRYEDKGEPVQNTGYTVSAVPAKIGNVAFVRNNRRRPE